MSENNKKYFPPTLDYRIPDIDGETNLRSIRRIISFLANQANTRGVADEIITSLSNARDEFGELIFTDMRKTSPHVILAEQLAHIGSMVNYMTANTPLLIEDYLLGIMGEPPVQGMPEFVLIVYRLVNPLDKDYTISKGRKVKNEEGNKLYTSVYPLTIPAGFYGDELTANEEYRFTQLYRSDNIGLIDRVAPGELVKADSSITYVKDIFNPESSFGGREPETYNDYRIRVFQEPRDGLAVTPSDHVELVKKFIGPETRAVIVASDSMASRDSINKVRISAILPNGEIMTPTGPTGLALKNYLADKDPNSIIEIVAPTFTDVHISLSVVMESKATYESAEQILLALRGVLRDASNPLKWEDWGERENNLTVDKIIRYIKNSYSDIDTVSVSRLSYANKSGEFSFSANEKEAVAPSMTVMLDSIVGLPNIILDSVVVKSEEV